jgi:hypothetical protein
VRDPQAVQTLGSPEEGNLKVSLGVFAKRRGAADTPVERAKRGIPEVRRLVDDAAAWV